MATLVALTYQSSHTQQQNPASQLPSEYVFGELLIKCKSDSRTAGAMFRQSPQQDIKQDIEQIGGHIVRDFPSISWQQVRLPPEMSVAEGLERYRSLPGVEMVQPNFVYHTLATPNDPRFSELYGLTKIAAPTAWNTTTGSSNVVVADIDLGVDYNHEDLKDNMWHNPGETGLDAQGHDKATNGIDDDGDGYVDDVYGIDSINHDSDPMDDSSFSHGTHTSGTIGATGNNAKGVAGVNWTVRIMAIKSHD